MVKKEIATLAQILEGQAEMDDNIVTGKATKPVGKKSVKVKKLVKVKVEKLVKVKVEKLVKVKVKKSVTGSKLSAGSLRTKEFQNLLQKNFNAILNERSKELEIPSSVAYKLFKESFDSVVQFLLDQETKLPLSGVGTFKIEMTPPRAPVNGSKSELMKYKEIPHLKWHPSERYKNFIREQVLGYRKPK